MDRLQLTEFVDKLKISPVEIIREEVEVMILDQIARSQIGNSLIFKGGTALRLCYGSPRFSQDLDFNQIKTVSLTKLKTILRRIVIDNGELQIKDLFDKRQTLFSLLLVRSQFLKQNFSIKIEISKKKYNLRKKDFTIKVISSPVSALRPVIYVYSLERILKEKKIALKTRNEPRDYFDLWYIGEVLKIKVDFPPVKMSSSRFKGELNQLLPDYLKNWSSDFLEKYGQHHRS